MISANKAYELQNKYKGAMTSGGSYWGQISWIRIPSLKIEGMLAIVGQQGSAFCEVSIHTSNNTVVVDDTLADKLLANTECPICFMEEGRHKMDCPKAK